MLRYFLGSSTIVALIQFLFVYLRFQRAPVSKKMNKLHLAIRNVHNLHRENADLKTLSHVDDLGKSTEQLRLVEKIN